MNEDLDGLLRDHYRAAADEIHADATAVRRFQEAGHAVAPGRASVLRGWAFPALAAVVTAAVLVAVAVLFWPGARDPQPPRPMAPPTAPVSPSAPPTPVPSAVTPGQVTSSEAPTPTTTPTASPTPDPQSQPLG
ncbi:hypothetical protein [Actinomadura sp. BRA 177]|uniref:hypothetical protein n=1 Tax=Actinomadura sp. BRA 177 TaxID=2745202 RepID=UPI00159558F3|nr:hypothetical protein [Actinomadura sp. BRA 177]NVI91934.1 hypothetical protein [Actinomadura sp. BRA 177]